mgnify:CR=1 FL=1
MRLTLAYGFITVPLGLFGALAVGSLADVALWRLEEKMQEIKTVFGLADEELNIDLGPLGRVL